ncbi:endothelial cell-specific chemotaxis regulator isoform X2 [Cervus canadensis]|uniref:endothelial cell-specific chemotaxis regulator isoform X2 n=1 Tax=Cervus canadensis TaxID=1574408 RepID=UPI001C9E9509|nr:endothelial cell-specific chemotaxis regulator isoform X2 [Cervus canadensis]
MGSIGETQLRWAILSFLLLQGAFSSQSSTTQPTSPETSSSTEANSLSPLSDTWTTASEMPSQISTEAVTLSSSTVAGHLPSSPGLTWSQSQKHTSGLNTSSNVISTSPNMSFRMTADSTVPPSPTSETVLTVAAFGVISFIAILVVVVIVLVSVVSLRFKCQKNKESEDPQKPGSSGLSESGSTANGEKESITLISMKNINMNNSKGCPSAEKVL